MHMMRATLDEDGTEKLHERHSPYMDLPSSIAATDVASLIHYVEVVVAYRHPELRWLTFVPDGSAQVTQPESDFCRYAFNINVWMRPVTRPDLLEVIIVEAGQALAAHVRLADGRRPGIGLPTATCYSSSERTV